MMVRKMDLPRISIVTPSYNQGKFLEDTINSVIQQDYPNLEYIIIDGGSTDNSVEIINKYSSYISYWVSEKDNGQTSAINKGFQIATGDIIAWINSDDVYCPGAFSKISEYFLNHKQCYWLAGSILFMTKDGVVKSRKYPNSSKWLERNAMMSVYQPNVFLRRTVLNDIGFPQENFHMLMDFEWYCRIARKYSLHVIDFDIAKFRLHPDSKSSSPRNSINQKIYHQEAVSIIRKYHCSFSWMIDRYPELSFQTWWRTSQFFRMMKRIMMGEFKKLNDKYV